ncbi:MAG: hypothetical protein AMXMBFR84_32200 [Candidatus Hydrogenedentota bacterium]
MNYSENRRQFLKTAATGVTAFSMSAASYARIVGANDRIAIGIIGCGSRGIGTHMMGINAHAAEQNIAITAVCDPWKVKQDEAANLCKDWYGLEARKFSHYRDLLALEDVDAVTIASCDHQHPAHLKAAAEAGKDVYVEKPLGTHFQEVKDACQAVRDNGVIVQVGTQLRSLPGMVGANELFKTGILGSVSRIEQHRNGWRPYWYQYLKEVRQEDVDWNEFLMNQPPRPFDMNLYSGWYGYRGFSDGPVPGFGSHYIDLVHFITGAQFPVSSVCQGGTFTWKDDYGFTCPDHVEATWIYPEGFMATYSTNFGNGGGNAFKIYGQYGAFDLLNWDRPMLTGEGAGPDKMCVAEPKPIDQIPRPDHMLDWLQCIRSRNTPHASIEAGYQHAVAVIMAMQAYDSGKRMIFDPQTHEIREG